MLNRRAALALSGAAWPFLARAQAPELPTVVPPTVTPAAPAPTVPAPVPGLTPVPAPAAPPAPSPAPARPGGQAAIDRSRTYFVFFDQTIDVNSVRLLRRQLTALVDAGVAEIDLVISSPGGLVFQALNAYSLVRSLPARVNTHATGLVASAANLLFLAGEGRSADRNARFFFHASQGAVIGTLSGAQLRDRLAQFAALTAMQTEIYKDRTLLPDEQIARFEREEVFYTPDQAREYGIVQTVADLHIPGGNKSGLLFIE